VIKSKAAVSVEELGERYCLLGPYNDSCVRTEVEILEPSLPAMRDTIYQMRDHGIKVSHVIQWINIFRNSCFVVNLPRDHSYI
jgi:glycogen(starch) synthase